MATRAGVARWPAEKFMEIRARRGLANEALFLSGIGLQKNKSDTVSDCGEAVHRHYLE
jgi:hypothetical protein